MSDLRIEDVVVIEDEEACELAAELADLTGESLQVAMIMALRAELGRARARKERDERIMAITREIAMNMRDPFRAVAA
ncbi:MAG TPA: type II toxin-antitoxin system VapB family antitoxin [Acetobacteraceae bacterium]|nr:type II toxin-antitoxin system VapB family antitoxin [Acetobacteraceae bacterium]